MEDDSPRERVASRRPYTRTTGLITTAVTDVVVNYPRRYAARAIGFREKCLSNGGSIDEHLAEYVSNGSGIHVPAGENEYTRIAVNGRDEATFDVIGS